jgi:hypothetical protein
LLFVPIALLVAILTSCSSATATTQSPLGGPLRHLSDGDYKICLPDEAPGAHHFATATTFTNTGNRAVTLRAAGYPRARNGRLLGRFTIPGSPTFDLYPLPFPSGAAGRSWARRKALRSVSINPNSTVIVAIEVARKTVSRDANLGYMEVNYLVGDESYRARSTVAVELARETCHKG